MVPPFKTLLALFCFGHAAAPCSATPTFSSPYLGQNPGMAADQDGVIGLNGQFDIQSLSFTNIAPGNVTVQIDFNYDFGDTTLSPFTVAGHQLQVGDLLFTNGTNDWGVSLTSHGGSSSVPGDLYSVDRFLTAFEVLGFPVGPLSYNPNDPVWMHSFGEFLIGAGTANTVSIGGDEVQSTVSFTPDASFDSALIGGNMLVSFASATCANDFLSGTIGAGSLGTVPEPSGFLLLGSGLLAVSFIRRLRR